MPSVTAVMVTGHDPARRCLALHTIYHFTRQTYPDCELLVLNQSDERLLCQPNPPRVREVLTGQGLILGATRNLAWELSTSDLLCCWDDDDIHHVDMIDYMVGSYDANVVAPINQLVAMLGSEIVFVSTMPGGYTNSMLWPRSCKARYPEIARREDTIFFARLRKEFKVVPLDNPPHYYVRLFHGHNVWGEEHFRTLPRSDKEVTGVDRGYLADKLPAILDLGIEIPKIRNVDLRGIEQQLLVLVQELSGARRIRKKSRLRADLRMDTFRLQKLEYYITDRFKVPFIGRLSVLPQATRAIADYTVAMVLRMINKQLGP